MNNKGETKKTFTYGVTGLGKKDVGRTSLFPRAAFSKLG